MLRLETLETIQLLNEEAKKAIQANKYKSVSLVELAKIKQVLGV